MTENSNPRFEVWSTVAWDGKDCLLAANLHFDRMERHAHRLNFSLP
jgi:branched-subunit amino acid aminotransferase/4-amino-4-deoxychorismate lyase